MEKNIKKCSVQFNNVQRMTLIRSAFGNLSAINLKLGTKAYLSLYPTVGQSECLTPAKALASPFPFSLPRLPQGSRKVSFPPLPRWWGTKSTSRSFSGQLSGRSANTSTFRRKLVSRASNCWEARPAFVFFYKRERDRIRERETILHIPTSSWLAVYIFICRRKCQRVLST